MRTVLFTAMLVLVVILPAPAQTNAVSSPAPQASNTPAPASSGTAGVKAPSPTATTLSEFARARVDTMLHNRHADVIWFSASFLNQIPVARVDAILAQITASLGSYKTTDGTNGDYLAHFEKGSDEVLMHLDADNKIDGLFFKPPKLQTSSLDEALRALRSPSGTLSYIIVQGRSKPAALDPSAPLAVGSAFKLAVLAALRDEIAAGRRHWDDVIPLEAEWKSLPAGTLRSWPNGTPLTLATYAAQMISISDNTAADALSQLVGPAAIAPYARGNMPFLTTREAFVLKSTPGSAQRSAYLAAKTSEQRAVVLRAADTLPLPTAQELEPKPMLAVEWHYSVRELCELMGRVADLPLMSINPGGADDATFERVAYKGGSDTGVINLTTQVTTKRGTRFCFSATLNDPAEPVDDDAFTRAYSLALNSLATR